MRNYSKYLVCFELNDNASDNSDAKNANAKQVLSSSYYYMVLVLWQLKGSQSLSCMPQEWLSQIWQKRNTLHFYFFTENINVSLLIVSQEVSGQSAEAEKESVLQELFSIDINVKIYFMMKKNVWNSSFKQTCSQTMICRKKQSNIIIHRLT